MNKLNFELVEMPSHNFLAPDINEANKCIMHASIGTKLFICKLDYCLKVDEPSTNGKKNEVCVYICSKFSVKSEAKCKSRLFNGCCLQIGRVGTYRQVITFDYNCI